MMRIRVVTMVVLLLAVAPHGVAGRDDMLFATFSIAAVDAQTGDLGVGVSTKAPAVGSVVPWALAGVGAVATQAWTNPEFGPRGLTMLEEGLEPSEVLERLLENDERPESRQVGVINAKGETASHTGEKTLAFAGSIEGENFTIQGNLLAGRQTLEAMAESFRSTEGKSILLTERLLRAIEAGQEAGGDRRGRQSAALYVRSTDADRKWDRASNLRVDDHEDPIRELRRLHDKIRGTLGYRTFWRATGGDVSELQRLLSEAGLYEGEVTGEFDDATVKAVQEFRKARAMSAGEYGAPVGLVDAEFVERLKAWIASRGKADKAR